MALATRARIAGILAICLLMVSAPGAMAGAIYQPDAQIRRGSSSSYVGDNVYFPIIQSVSNTGVVGQKLTFFIKIQNDGVTFDAYKVKRSGVFNVGFRVRYYDSLNNDVTGQVNAGTYLTPLLSPFGGEYVMRATVKIRSQATACSSPVQRTMTVTSALASSLTDEVRFAVGLNVC